MKYIIAGLYRPIHQSKPVYIYIYVTEYMKYIIAGLYRPIHQDVMYKPVYIYMLQNT